MNIEKHYKEVKKFNSIAGNFEEVGVDKLDNQLSFIFEELQETITALEESDPKELVDGAGDLVVTVFGFIQLLDKAGFNVDEAISRITANNLSKFPKNLSDDNGVKLQPSNSITSFNPMYNCFVFKNYTGKVVKPTNFKAVDLTGTYDPEFFCGYGDLK